MEHVRRLPVLVLRLEPERTNSEEHGFFVRVVPHGSAAMDVDVGEEFEVKKQELEHPCSLLTSGPSSRPPTSTS